MKIILDAMSGDHAPLEILRGAVAAKSEFPEIGIVLVGDPDIIRTVAGDNALSLSDMEIREAASVISMEDEALSVIHGKKDSSMAVGLKMLAQDEGDAFVSAGNTGALLAGASLIVRRIKGVARPGIGAILPLSNPVLLLDSGANITVTEENLEVLFGNEHKATYKAVVSNRFDSKAFKKDGYEDLYKAYQKPSTSMRFTFA